MKTVVVMDQFYSPSPYYLQTCQQNGTPYTWKEFVQHVEEGKYNFDAARPARPKVEEIDETTYKCEWATTVFAEDANGNVSVLMAKWDSSG